MSVVLSAQPDTLAEGVRTVNILGVRVSTLSAAATADWIVARAARAQIDRTSRYVCATSVHGLIEAHHDSRFRAVLNRAALVTADGMPLVWGGRLGGASGMERVYGPTLMKNVCARSVGRPIRHFFYGGAEGVAQDLAQRLAGEFPGLLVAGTYTPPFRPLTPEELASVAGLIKASGANIIWVGLSTPKQEWWIDSIRPLLATGVLVSVGAAFDFHTGRVAQAPSWLQRAGLEWLFRLTREPRRLWRRYAVNNPTFVALALLQITGLRDFGDGRP